MIPFGTIEPVRVVSVREWVSRREAGKAERENREPQKSRAIRVVESGDNAGEPVELFLAPAVNGHTPAEGELVHLRLAARSRGWETVIAADGTETRRNGGTAFSVRDVVAVAPATGAAELPAA